MLSLLILAALERKVISTGRYTIELDPKRDPAVSVSCDRKQIWRGVKKAWKPWKLLITDVDANGKPDFALGLFKSTQYMPKPHNCIFVYGIDGRQVFARWKGSRLDQAFFDFVFVKREGKKPMLVTINALLDGRRCLAGYVWNGFGFDKLMQQGTWKTLQFVRVEAPDVVVLADGTELRVKVE